MGLSLYISIGLCAPLLVILPSPYHLPMQLLSHVSYNNYEGQTTERVHVWSSPVLRYWHYPRYSCRTPGRYSNSTAPPKSVDTTHPPIGIAITFSASWLYFYQNSPYQKINYDQSVNSRGGQWHPDQYTVSHISPPFYNNETKAHTNLEALPICIGRGQQQPVTQTLIWQ